MNAQGQTPPGNGKGFRFFDGFTRTMLATMFVILLAIFISGNYMSAHKMAGGGTDDKVNNLAATTAHSQHHPFVVLPGDAEVGAFSVANFFAGIIVGYHWLRLFGTKTAPPTEEKKE
jgi:cobalt/nickel transport protein